MLAGKTLLAKAIAGEAGVPFYSAAGTEFMEVFVGVGASRVRDMFQKARKAAPCILFIDEFDGIGQQRSSNAMGNDGEAVHSLQCPGQPGSPLGTDGTCGPHVLEMQGSAQHHLGLPAHLGPARACDQRTHCHLLSSEGGWVHGHAKPTAQWMQAEHIAMCHPCTCRERADDQLAADGDGRL